ncbi:MULTISPECIES: hydroxyethylthiazole kinase [unclassified Actinomyces]|uniref:hydroxyethylthiazole kinase n=1 Tax=unclassified Actinomyces TaxID=2609248 RepID=UPI001373C4F2|nr:MULTISPECIES: hydroxyethylthiazole kinase [unclassified Actinomyces]MBW3068165.1 hydroxyethylthiazole kinase [Actinomyces sp. 594]NDR54543.1 hydroxyethylthiazole kinase [Actinomyces sp. 565]QHO91093.1 hydroxyethylthiazole kinase [Actinomyces sp. 432]
MPQHASASAYSSDCPAEPSVLRAPAPPAGTAEVLESLRAAGPLVACITNSVVTNFTANVLLATGAAPAMVDVTGEAGPFAAVASALLINLGTPQPEQRAAALEAAAAARAAGVPWVLDPVAVGTLVHRTELAHRLLEEEPTVIRGNASEIMALAGSGAGGRGVETADDVAAALGAARALSARTGAVVAVSGPVDAIVDDGRLARVGGGSALLTRVTGGGCALGALAAGFLAAGRAIGTDAFAATVACHAVYSAAAEIAAETAAGPGSFQVALLDSLYCLDADDLARIPVS